MRRYLILILFFYFLTLFQNSFLVYFTFKGYVLNLVLLITLLINFLESQKEKFGFFSAFCGGFFLDVFSENFWGYWMLILLFNSFFIKYIIKKIFII